MAVNISGNDLWGTPAGEIAGGQELLSTALGLSTMEQQGAHSRYYHAGAKKLELEAEEEQRLMEIMQRRAAGIPPGEFESGSLSEEFGSLAQDALSAGLVNKSQELAKTSSLVGQREASARSSNVTAALNRVKQIREQAEMTGQIFGGVSDNDSWRRANALWEFQTGIPSPYAAVPYNPELVKSINSSALSTKERADLEEKRLSRENLEDFRDSRISQHDRDLAIKAARLRIAKAREARLAKAGGGRSVSSPSTAETDQARSLITRDYGKLDAKDLQDASFAVAAEARALRRTNPALDANVALQQAYNNAKAAGDFKLGSTWFGMGTSQSYRGGMRGTRPLPIKDNKLDTGALTVGEYYTNAKGVTGRWNGKTFVIETPRGGRALSNDNRRPDDEDEDEEE